MRKLLYGILFMGMFFVAGAACAADTRLLFIGGQDDAALLGARQGLTEANLQGKFLQQSYTLDEREPGAAGDLAGYVAILAAVDAATLKSLAAAAPGIPVFNLRVHDDALRAACVPNLLHVIPSDAMDHDAVAQWHSKHPDSSAQAAAWHPDFTMYAGRDLNKRYLAAAGRPMDDYAWAGWAAVKMTSDTFVRLGNTDAGQLLAHLRDELRFDGQKGAEMSFRKTGQLRQPLLLVEGGKIVGEAPVRGVADADDLDSLGNTHCAP